MLHKMFMEALRGAHYNNNLQYLNRFQNLYTKQTSVPNRRVRRCMVCTVKVDANIPVMLSQEVFDDWDLWVFQITGVLASSMVAH